MAHSKESPLKQDDIPFADLENFEEDAKRDEVEDLGVRV